MAGIIFLKTANKATIQDFYVKVVGMDMWLEQEDCVILQHENLLLGFCERGVIDRCGIITFFYKTRDEVDTMYKKLATQAQCAPQISEKYKIYHFFAEDPEKRTIEFQSFLHSLKEGPAADTSWGK